MAYDSEEMRSRRSFTFQGLVQRYLTRRGITVFVILAFASLLLFTIIRHPTFEVGDEYAADDSAGSTKSTLSEKAAELPHNPTTDSPAQSLTEQAAVAVESLVANTPHSVFDFKTKWLDSGEAVSLSTFSGQVALVVNVASFCGFTEVNYKELQILYHKYAERGFTVLAFPCNQFGGQEPGTPSEIQAVARDKFHTTFPLFEKVDVNGPNTHPLFQFLKDKFGMKHIPWNFQKFVVDRHGQPVHQYPSQIDPLVIEGEIVKLLDKDDNDAA